MNEFVLDASFAVRWCFEDEATPQTEKILSALENEETVALVPDIWRFEVLNGLGKGVMRQRLTREKGPLLWREMQALPIRVVEVPGNEDLLRLSLQHNLSVYDACYLVERRHRSP